MFYPDNLSRIPDKLSLMIILYPYPNKTIFPLATMTTVYC